METSSQATNSGPSTATAVTTDGLEEIFQSRMSPAMSDTRRTKKIELPVNEAAKTLGISERTLWRRIEDGEIKSRLKGNKRFVKVPIDQLGTSSGSATDTPRTSVGAVIELKEILDQLAGANYRVGFLQGQLEETQAQLRLLPDLQAKADDAANLRARLAAAEAEIEYLKRPWWKLLLGLH